jgi:hypothetical protein
MVAALVLFVAACVGAQSPASHTDGPYSIHFLTGGPEVSMNLAAGNALLRSPGKFALSFWFRAQEVVEGPVLLAGVGDPEARDGRYVALEGGHLVLWNDSSCPAIASAKLDATVWHHAVLSSGGAGLSLVADGELVAQCSAPRAAARPVLRVGPRTVHTKPFGGEIAYLQLESRSIPVVESAARWKQRPDFSLPLYEEAAQTWPVQTHGQSGYSTSQDPATLPRSRAEFAKIVGKPLRAEERQTRLEGDNPWRIAGGWKLRAVPATTAAGAVISTAGFNTDGWYDARFRARC